MDASCHPLPGPLKSLKTLHYAVPAPVLWVAMGWSNLGQRYQVAQDLGLSSCESLAVWLLMEVQRPHGRLQSVTGSAVFG